MVMKKTLKSDATIVVGGSSESEMLFPPGFSYRMGSIVYTVKRDCTQEAQSPMREVFLSDGATEIIPIETLLKDIKEINNSRNKVSGEILEPDERYTIKKAVAKKVTKKKKRKKNAKNNSKR
jgi:hypothetical protein